MEFVCHRAFKSIPKRLFQSKTKKKDNKQTRDQVGLVNTTTLMYDIQRNAPIIEPLGIINPLEEIISE